MPKKDINEIDIKEIDEDYLQSLVDTSRLEDRRLDYKVQLPGTFYEDKKVLVTNEDKKRFLKDKKEFLEDICAFANTDGGTLIYGIADKAEVPTNLKGLKITKEKAAEIKSRTLDIIRDCTEPPILGVDYHPVEVKGGSKMALIVRVPKSYSAPHRIKLKDLDAYYGRRANGIYPMDVEDLRRAFILSETRIERIRRFRDERIQKVSDYESRIPLYGNAKTALHLIPIDAFDPGKRYNNIDVIFNDKEALKPMFRIGPRGSSLSPFVRTIERRYNLDGVRTYSNFRARTEIDRKGLGHAIEPYTCVQLFTNGIIEAVELRELNSINDKVIFDKEYEPELIKSLSNYLDVLKTLGVEPPVFLFLTLLGVRDYRLSRGYQIFDHGIDRDRLAIPEQIIKKFDEKLEHILRPCFDSIWNACGYPKCFNYDKGDNWTVKDTDKRILDYIKSL